MEDDGRSFPSALAEVRASDVQHFNETHDTRKTDAVPHLTEAVLMAALQTIREDTCNHVQSIKEELLREVDEIKIELRAQVRPLKRKIDNLEKIKSELEAEVRPLQHKIDKLEKIVRTSVMTSLEVLQQLEYAQFEAEDAGEADTAGASSSRKADEGSSSDD